MPETFTKEIDLKQLHKFSRPGWLSWLGRQSTEPEGVGSSPAWGMDVYHPSSFIITISHPREGNGKPPRGSFPKYNSRACIQLTSNQSTDW